MILGVPRKRVSVFEEGELLLRLTYRRTGILTAGIEPGDSTTDEEFED
jgi:hypothetical protein